jgi:hypothetical protein
MRNIFNKIQNVEFVNAKEFPYPVRYIEDKNSLADAFLSVSIFI